MKSELAIARDAWLQSEEGKSCCNITTLPRIDGDKFLRNRIERAFLAGAKASEDMKTANKPSYTSQGRYEY